MKNFNWYSIILLFVGVISAPSLLFSIRPPSPITDARQATVLVTMPSGVGSGVLVSRKISKGHWRTYVWTAAHVILNGPVVETDIKITGWSHVTTTARVMAYSVPNDLALLEIKTLDYSTTSVRFYHGAPLEIGAPVFHIGNLYGDEMPDSYTAGVLSSTNWDGQYYQLNLAVYPGSSGGGVFTVSGQCLGLVDKRRGEGIAMAVPIQLLEAWAHTNGFGYALP